jgi:hypothetical protein
MKPLSRLPYFLAMVLVCAQVIPAFISNRAAPAPLTIPAGTVLILEMETELHSGHTRASDRFTARVSEPLTDTAGNILVPEGSLVEGYVKAVTSARMKRRPGMIEVVFDRLRLDDDRVLPLSGVLVNADTRTTRKIDEEEGTINGATASKRSVVIVGAGAIGAGATAGIIAGSAILGAGVGAAAGVAGAFLAKGEDAVVYPGTVVGVALTQPLELNYQTSSRRENIYSKPAPTYSTVDEWQKSASRDTRDVSPDISEPQNSSVNRSRQTVARSSKPAPSAKSAAPAVSRRDLQLDDDKLNAAPLPRTPATKAPVPAPSVPRNDSPQQQIIADEPVSIPAQTKSDDPTLIRLMNFQLDRAKDGGVELLLTGETNSAGWRLYTTYATDRDLLQIWLHGERPNDFTAQVMSRPSIRFKMPDAMRVLRRVVVHGTNGSFRGEIPQ